MFIRMFRKKLQTHILCFSKRISGTTNLKDHPEFPEVKMPGVRVIVFIVKTLQSNLVLNDYIKVRVKTILRR